MKVLWFANTPCNADEYFNTELKGTGGWLKALDIELQNHVDLHVAFYYSRNIKPFTFKKTKYYPIYTPKTTFQKIKNIIVPSVINREHIDIYKAIVDEVKPDIIHIHGTENPFGYIITETNIPVVISIQGIITVYYHRFLSGLGNKYLSTKIFSIKKPLEFFKPYKIIYRQFNLMMKREQEILKNAKHIIGRTDWDYSVTRVLAPNSRYYHVDEILRESFYENAGKWQPHTRDKLIVFTTTGPSYYKGLETACQALWELQNIGVDVEWRFAGINGNDLIVKIVKKYLGQKYPKFCLKYLGKLNERMLITQMLESDIYVMPSHIENSPNNLCEAMMLGMPCIASFSGGTSSMLNNKVEGVLIQDGDPWVLAGSILDYINKKEKYIEYGINAYKRASKRHKINNIVSNLIKNYSQIISFV